MHSPEQCFTRFTADISGYDLPAQFTFPFYYTPHPLCVLAAEQLQQHLMTQTDFEHDFGLEALGMGQEALHEVGALNAIHVGGPVVDFGGRHELAALGDAGDQDGVEVGPCGVNGGGVSGGSGTQNEYFGMLHGESSNLRPVRVV